ncbi:hypothetical protein BC624_105144 [Flavobacterium granuli]|uniref:Uncharacterized protein n=1 Tax=Flavobacterium granuli TaxID=280093 RepID=A0A1M5NWJ9_9FLAO|nr:hypothetical protein BC624_105144 [Flavobacterium granuli]SHG93880.1 hypothetical protein SAMN05443373_105144 [Flavobacterium granuli]
MMKFWLIAILIFIVITYILSKFTLESNRKEAGERIWRFGNGRSTYWRILTLCSFGITAVIMLILHWIGIPIL